MRRRAPARRAVVNCVLQARTRPRCSSGYQRHYKVIRHARPKFACTAVRRLVQSPAPSRPIARGLAGPGLLAHVLVSKYADHLPLYRQSQIFARDGMDLDRSTLADWVGGASALLEPLVGAFGRMCSPPTSCTPTIRRCRCWPGTGHDRQGGCGPTCAMIGRPAARIRRRCCCATPRTARRVHPVMHLGGFRGILQADGYAGFDPLYGERDPGGGVLGARAPQVLRLPRRTRLAARRRGARADRPALCGRG